MKQLCLFNENEKTVLMTKESYNNLVAVPDDSNIIIVSFHEICKKINNERRNKK